MSVRRQSLSVLSVIPFHSIVAQSYIHLAQRFSSINHQPSIMQAQTRNDATARMTTAGSASSSASGSSSSSSAASKPSSSASTSTASAPTYASRLFTQQPLTWSEREHIQQEVWLGLNNPSFLYAYSAIQATSPGRTRLELMHLLADMPPPKQWNAEDDEVDEKEERDEARRRSSTAASMQADPDAVAMEMQE